LKGIEFPWPLAEVALQHHERMNGSGYPHGLQGEDILIDARIVGVADVLEAMVSHRPYRPALGIEKAMEEMQRNRGVLYHPEVADACLHVFQEGRLFGRQ
jgi:HD-GYP domain-containing protein (c-di-GMP phosphodiesterase class II)